MPEVDAFVAMERILATGAEIQQGNVISSITTLDTAASPQATIVKPRQVIGVGNVGRIPGRATYTLYNPAASNQVVFKAVRYGSGKGF